jgi:hypothetical protein
MLMIGRDGYTRFLGNRRWIRTAAIATREEVARLFRGVHDDINTRLLPKRSV